MRPRLLLLLLSSSSCSPAEQSAGDASTAQSLSEASFNGHAALCAMVHETTQFMYSTYRSSQSCPACSGPSSLASSRMTS